jgi:hypothetical protein
MTAYAEPASVKAPTSPQQPIPASARWALVGLALVCLAFAALACDSPAKTPRPSPSLITLQFTPQPSRTSLPSASPTPRASVGGWPLGWDEDFCAMFGQAVDTQQLLVDVQLDIQDGNNKDAKQLANELLQSANATRSAIDSMPVWSDGFTTLVAVADLMDLASRAGTEYHSWFADGRQAALRRAKDLRKQNGAAVPDANTLLAGLADKGITCQGTPLQLEAPG